MKSSPRSSFLAALGGIVLLAVVVGFVLVLPHDDAPADGFGATDAAAAPITTPRLPDTLSNGLTAVDLGSAAMEKVQAGVSDQVKKSEASAQMGMSNVFGVGSQTRIYADDKLTKYFQVTEIDTAPGPFLPQGPPVAASVQGVARSTNVLRSNGDAVCALQYQSPIAQGQPVPADDQPDQFSCQLVGTPATWQVSAAGVDVKSAVNILKGLASATS